MAPSSGQAEVFGKDISDDMSLIRQSLGVCPQHDILFPTMTVKEHLCLFAKLKGVKSENLDSAVDQAIKEVQLDEKRNAEASTLSGGQKRRLSLAIAFIGDSHVVFLDGNLTQYSFKIVRHLGLTLFVYFVKSFRTDLGCGPLFASRHLGLAFLEKEG